MLSNAYFLAKFRFDTAENEPAKNLQNFRKMHFSKMHFRKILIYNPGPLPRCWHTAEKQPKAPKKNASLVIKEQASVAPALPKKNTAALPKKDPPKKDEKKKKKSANAEPYDPPPKKPAKAPKVAAQLREMRFPTSSAYKKWTKIRVWNARAEISRRVVNDPPSSSKCFC